MTYPLEGVRVLDLSRVLAGPFAGRMLSDLGADVVKLEPPQQDLTRLWGAVIGQVPGYFHQQNAGKRDICIDLSVPDGVELAKSLAAKADIVIENFRPGVMDRLGLGYQQLKAARKDLILLSISGFGQDSPESQRMAYAPTIHAESGLVRRQARDGRPPQDIRVSMSDTNAALHGLVAVLAAMHLRQTTGLGQHIDMSMLDATVVTDDQLLYHLEDSHDTGPAVSDIWETGFGPVLIAGDFRHIWRQLNTRMNVEDPTPEGVSLEEKIRHRRDAAAKFFRSLSTRSKVQEIMESLGLAWGVVRDSSTLMDSDSVRHRGVLTEVDDRAGGLRVVPQSPYRFSDAEAGVRGGAPHRGEHNEEVLRDWLELDDEDTARWLSSDAVIEAEF
ncbi:MAG: CoA transferase [Pseudomonadales bacterium]